MSTETIGLLSGAICTIGTLPYIYRVAQGAIRPQITSWVLWAFIGLALLLTYRSSGAKDNIWPAVAGFINPTAIAILAIWRKGEWTKLGGLDYVCGICGIAALLIWWRVRNDPDMAQYALYLAIFADVCAAGPTFKAAWVTPWEDRPYAWFAFATGVFVSLFAISDYTFANFAYPVYMVIGSTTTALLLLRFRIRTRSPLREWY
ncbi:MAG TPA: hypothetical protein VHC20_02270 [Candidatus Paceibacterota bacterium]|nr:hypothetical protein [Candidatus Paceibacterota bacterium]